MQNSTRKSEDSFAFQHEISRRQSLGTGQRMKRKFLRVISKTGSRINVVKAIEKIKGGLFIFRKRMLFL